ncbi:Uncharacterised protein [Mycobacteroides abscessus subsp. abscessus]|nr:Uncharacterised protein [Mycobacteroides abscessus subsp. abscessus]
MTESRSTASDSVTYRAKRSIRSAILASGNSVNSFRTSSIC